RVAGPFRVRVALVGYRQEVQDQIQLTLGGTADLRFALPRATLELEPVTVTATSNPVFSAERTGPRRPSPPRRSPTCRPSAVGSRTSSGSRRSTVRCPSGSRSPARTTG